ncbi:helix-turn-helix transcriptional regulator [Chromobacterium amazonense]|uniref:helix-turn-helix transcriptional regulator n=1 Tax=Chromobacterium amazonense TaxID=1382803 RepID=UPI00245707B8|nr:helix-turn-helix domain-containing protein [Chromobacterium amazonense]
MSPQAKPLSQHVPPSPCASRQAPQHSDSDRANQEQREDSLPTKTLHRLLPTSWLAQRLNISVMTIERLRAQQSPDIPPHITIGKSIRYDERVVEAWLQNKMGLRAPLPIDAPAAV